MHTLPMAATTLKVEYNHLYHAVRTGKLPCIQIDRVRLLTDQQMKQAKEYFKHKETK